MPLSKETNPNQLKEVINFDCYFSLWITKVFTERKPKFNRKSYSSWGCPHGVMVKAVDLLNRRKRVRTPVSLLRSLSGKYPCKRYEPPYPPSYGLNSTTTVLPEE